MPSVTFNFDIHGADQVPRTYKVIEKAAEQSVAAAVKAAQKGAKEVEKAEAQKQRAAQKTAKEAEKAEAQKAKAATKSAKDAERATDKAAKDFQKAEEQKRRAGAQTFKYLDGIRTRFFAQEQRDAERAAKAVARERAKSLKSDDRSNRRIVGGIGIAALGAGALAAGVVGSALRDEAALKGKANRISVAGRRAGQETMSAGEITSALHGAAASAPGVSADDLAGGVSEMVKLGSSVPDAVAHLKTMATAMQSMGTDAEGTAKIMMALKQSFGISGTKEMQQSMATLEAQAKSAGIPLEDLSSHILTMAAAGKRFGMTGTKGAAQMGGILAIARSGIGDPEKAEKGATKFLDTVTKQAPKLAAMGVHVFDKKGGVNPINDVVKDLITHVGGSNMSAKKVELGKLLGVGERGGSGVIGHALGTYSEAFQSASGTKEQRTATATAALEKELAEVTGSTATYGDMQKNAAQLQEEAGAQLSAAWEKVTDVVGAELLPSLAGFASHAPEAVDVIIALASGVEEVFPVMDIFKENLLFLGEGIKEAASILGYKGKPQDPVKDLTKAQKELTHFEKSHKGMWNEEGEAEERARLKQKVDEAHGRVFDVTKQVPGHLMALGEDRFADKFADASGAEKGSFKWNRQRAAGMRLAEGAHDDPSRDLGIDAGVKVGVMNDEQGRLAHGLQDEEGAAKARAAFDAHAATLKANQTALDGLAKSAGTLNSALEKLGGTASRTKPISDHGG